MAGRPDFRSGGHFLWLGTSNRATYRPRSLRWGHVYIEGFNMYTGVWSVVYGSQFTLPAIKVAPVTVTDRPSRLSALVGQAVTPQRFAGARKDMEGMDPP